MFTTQEQYTIVDLPTYMPKSTVIAVAGVLFLAGREDPWANKFLVEMYASYATHMCQISQIMVNNLYSIPPLNNI